MKDIDDIIKEGERLLKESERVFENPDIDKNLTNEELKNQLRKNIMSKEEINRIIKKELVSKSEEDFIKELRHELATLYIKKSEYPSLGELGVFDDNIGNIRNMLKTIGVKLGK